MKNFVGIRTKLVRNTMLLIVASFTLVLSIVSAVNIFTINTNIKKTEKSIRNSLLAKGKTLVNNNSIAMRGMAEDNAFTAVRDLVTSTVTEDNDIIYGIYMDNQRIPWVNTLSDDNSQTTPLDDSISLWAASLDHLAFREYKLKGGLVIEFAAPVILDKEILGHIRYGISTKSMQQSINEARADGRSTQLMLILVILSTGLFSLSIGYIVVKQQATKITNPIGSLVASAKSITEGNYDIVVKEESNDEIGDLARRFDTMRATIKKYTDHLQELIDEKMQQVNDILNNIEQGLFTINLDGTVNKEYSARANEILMVKDVASCSINDLLRFDAKESAAFLLWLDLVRKLYGKQRWVKLAKLAPVQHIEFQESAGSSVKKYVSISYQPICNKKNELVKIMILALDETEKKIKDQQMAAEREKHENEVKTILSIANTPAEEIMEFTEDTSVRLRNLKAEISNHLYGVRQQRSIHPEGKPYSISKENIDRLYRDLHTIKGNSGSYGFDILSQTAHRAEDLIEKLREPLEDRRDIILQELNILLDNMQLSLEDIHSKIRLIYGKDEEITIRIPESRINKITQLCRNLEPRRERDQDIASLIAECNMLSWKPLKSLFRKYQKLALKEARKLHKNINFIVRNETVCYPADSLTDLDDILIHMIRNAVDHGIEDAGVRYELGKTVGRIEVSYECKDDQRILTIADDGSGIDLDRIVEISIEKKIISREEADKLSYEEKKALLFKGGVSTSLNVTEISGRGMGLQIVYDKVNRLGGSMTIDSQIGKGTTFTIIVPNKTSTITSSVHEV